MFFASMRTLRDDIVFCSTYLSSNPPLLRNRIVFEGAGIVLRRLRMFVRTFRKARALGFTFVDAMRAARVNSYTG